MRTPTAPSFEPIRIKAKKASPICIRKEDVIFQVSSLFMTPQLATSFSLQGVATLEQPIGLVTLSIILAHPAAWCASYR